MLSITGILQLFLKRLLIKINSDLQNESCNIHFYVKLRRLIIFLIIQFFIKILKTTDKKIKLIN